MQTTNVMPEAKSVTKIEPELPYYVPRADVRETSDFYEIFLEMPGVKKWALTVTQKNDHLIVQGKAQWNGEGHLIVSEIPKRHYRRIFKLTPKIDPSNIEARWMDGILVVRVGKKEEVKPRAIEINFN